MIVSRKIFFTVLLILIMLSAAECMKSNKRQGGSMPIQPDGISKPAASTEPQKPIAAATEAHHEYTDLKGLLSKSNPGNNYSWECIFTYKGNSLSYNYWVKDKKEKIEFVSYGRGSMVFYIDRSKKITYMYDSNNKSAIAIKGDYIQDTAMKPNEFLDNITQGDLSSYKKKGRVKVMGLDCTIYEYQYGSTLLRIYVSEKYQAAVKMESLVDGNINNSYLLKNYQTDTVTDDMVTLPKDTKITDLSSIGS